MNNDEATSIVREELMKYRNLPYAKLALLVGTRIPTVVVKGTSGSEYQVEVQVHWDAKPEGDIRVIGSIDDGGLRASVPLSQDFMTARDSITSATW